MRPRPRVADGGVTRTERLTTGAAESAEDSGEAAAPGGLAAGSLAARRRRLRSPDAIPGGAEEASTQVESDGGATPDRPRIGRAPRERDEGGPITAPTPIVRVFDDYHAPLDSPDDLDEPVLRNRATVLIRAGQAGTPEQTPAGPSAAGTRGPTPGDGTGRPGRLRLRRRFSGSSP